MAHMGLTSRREAKNLIVKGKVFVNGTKILEPGFGVANNDVITFDKSVEQKESVLVYKPKGIETVSTTANAKDLKDQFKSFKHLSPIGRLDKESQGLIIMSNDGTLTKALTKIDSKIGKTYLVIVRENITDNSLQKMERGILLDKIMTKPTKVNRKSRTSFTITLYEGRKHQIRRMCDACRLTIESLTRVGIGHLLVDNMKPGSTKKLK